LDLFEILQHWGINVDCRSHDVLMMNKDASDVKDYFV
jgi:hypothetical protein